MSVRSKYYDEQLFQWLDEHRDQLRCAKRGYIQRLSDLCREELHRDFDIPIMKQCIRVYRVVRNMPVEYVENKYYTSERKRAAQSLSQAHRSTSPSNALARSMSETPNETN